MIPQAILLSSAAASERLFGLDRQTVFDIGMQLANFIVLAIILSFLLYNPVRNFMKKRTERIKRQMEQAEIDMAEANRLKAQYEQKLNDISVERNEILDEARKQATEKSKQTLFEAKNEADAIKTRAQAEIELERERVKDEIKESIISISSAMAAKFVKQKMDKDMQNRLFDEAAAELEDVTWQN